MKLMYVLSGNILKYSSVNFLSKFNQKEIENPFSKVGKSVFGLQEFLFIAKDKSLFIPLKYI